MNKLSPQEYAEIFKGGANHYRVRILFLLAKNDSLILETVAELLKANYKTIAVHMSRLQRSGLVQKTYKGSAVVHSLTPRGKSVLKFLRILE